MSTPASQPSSQELEAFLNGPAGPPPPGVRPNFDDPANLNNFVILTLTLCLVFSSLTVFMRTYTKLFILRSWGYEDCMPTRILVSSPQTPRLTTSDALILGWVSFFQSITLPEALNLLAFSNCTSCAGKTDHE